MLTFNDTSWQRVGRWTSCISSFACVIVVIAASSALGDLRRSERAPGNSAGGAAEASRFRDCGNGTVVDSETGLQWEKKTGSFHTAIFCQTLPDRCSDPHDVNSRYGWGPGPGGTEQLLALLNGRAEDSHGESCFAQHCDWRLPDEKELRVLTTGRYAGTGPAFRCDASPCILPGFAAVGGATAPSLYWAASKDPLRAGPRLSFGKIHYSFLAKSTGAFARVVRTGTCP